MEKINSGETTGNNTDWSPVPYLTFFRDELPELSFPLKNGIGVDKYVNNCCLKTEFSQLISNLEGTLASFFNLQYKHIKLIRNIFQFLGRNNSSDTDHTTRSVSPLLRQRKFHHPLNDKKFILDTVHGIVLVMVYFYSVPILR